MWADGASLRSSVDAAEAFEGRASIALRLEELAEYRGLKTKAGTVRSSGENRNAEAAIGEIRSTAVKPGELWIRSLAVLVLTALMVGVAWLNFAGQPNNDFIEYYCAGEIVRAGFGTSLYDLATQFQCESKAGPVHVFFYHPAWESVLFLPFTYLSYRAAYFLWILVSVGLLLATVRIIESRSGATSAITEYTRVPADLGLLFALFLTFGPVMTCLLLGQDSLLLLAIYAVLFVLLDQEKDFLAGLVLACGLFKFQAVVPFVFILAIRRKWTILKGFSLGALLVVAVSVAVSGAGSLVGYPRFLIEGIHQNIGGFNPRATPNIRGLLNILIRDKLGNAPLNVLIAATSVLMLWWTARSWHEDQLRLSFAAGVMATILASFHLYNYELSLLLLPIAIVCGELTRRGTLRKQRVLTAGLIVLFIAPLHRFLSLRDAYALMSLPILMMLCVTLRQLRDSSGHVAA